MYNCSGKCPSCQRGRTDAASAAREEGGRAHSAIVDLYYRRILYVRAIIYKHWVHYDVHIAFAFVTLLSVSRQIGMKGELSPAQAGLPRCASWFVPLLLRRSDSSGKYWSILLVGRNYHMPVQRLLPLSYPERDARQHDLSPSSPTRPSTNIIIDQEDQNDFGAGVVARVFERHHRYRGKH